jgi:hypothetical protein
MTIVFKHILILFALFFIVWGNAQTTEHPKKIIKSVNGTVGNIKEFDASNLLIFEKEVQFWKDKSQHLFIDGYLYNENRVTHEYHANEDFLRIIRYEYDSITGLKEKFVKHTDKKKVDSSLLNSIENRDKLIALVESVIPKDSVLKNVLGPYGAHTLTKKRKRVVYRRYELGVEVMQITRKYDHKGNLVFEEEQNEWQTTVTKFKYNKQNQLIKRTHGFDDYLSETEYFYNNKLLSKTITKLRNGRTSSREYFYSGGLLVKEVIHKPEGDKTYEYSYEFFDK